MAQLQGTDPVKFIDGGLIEQIKQAAAKSPRLRMNFNFHQSNSDVTHRFLNVMLRGSYLCPHRHSTPPKPETFLILEGQLVLFTFDDDGKVTSSRLIGPCASTMGVDIAPEVWHLMVVLSDHIVCFETKPGPYDPTSPSELAPWAPREGQPGAAEFLQKMTGLAQRVVAN